LTKKQTKKKNLKSKKAIKKIIKKNFRKAKQGKTRTKPAAKADFARKNQQRKPYESFRKHRFKERRWRL
jgi:hypothetical protein